MRVGEILLEHGWVDAQSLNRAIAEQRHTGKRLCSLLISRGLLDHDHASRALGDQHGVAAVLQRHLENRDRSLAAMLPSALARSCFALPIGRNRAGELIICVRDPRPELAVALAQASGADIVIAVSPASQLEHLIDLAYEPSPTEEYDVDLTSDPRKSGPIPIGAELMAASRTLSIESLPDMTGFTLVELDDIGVTRDPTQSGPLAVQSGGRTTIPPFAAAVAAAPPAPSASPAPSIEATIAAIVAAGTRDIATDLALRYAHGRWASTLLLAIKEGAALGHRGHGAQLSADTIAAVSIPLAAPSIIKAAHDSKRIATEPPAGAGAIQERLVRMLGQPRAAIAAPIEIGGRVACVIAVGEPIGGGGDPARELARLATTLGEAYTRILRDKKP